MPIYLAPGVYVEEMPAGQSYAAAPRLGVEPLYEWTEPAQWDGQLGTAAFVGFAERGPVARPILLTDRSQFYREFGGELVQSYLAGSVEAFFANGGEQCYVVRVGEDRASDDEDVADFLARISGTQELVSLYSDAIYTLDAIPSVGLFASPDVWAAYQLDAVDMEGARAIQSAMITQAEIHGNCTALIDPPPGLNPQMAFDWRVDFASYDSTYAALYYPWVCIFRNVIGASAFVPPSGHIAGTIARSEQSRGTHLPPANVVLRGVLDLEHHLRQAERERLNPVGINALLAQPGRGIRIWGGRTLSSDPAWRYLHVRRFVNEIGEAISRGTQWALFQSSRINPGDDWVIAEKLVREISEYLHLLWTSGVLPGESPEEAFTVRCDEYTTPPEAQDAGQLIVEVGLLAGHPIQLRIVYFSP
jgi:phage tail sheath protein FI